MEKPLKTQREIAEAWLPIAIESLQEAMDKKGINSTRKKLFNSIVGNLIRGADGDVEKIIIRFAFYGRFVDMGVGNGVPIGGKKDLGGGFESVINEKGGLRIKRKAKMWYSKTKTHEIERLSTLMLRHLNVSTISVIEREWEKGEIDINLQI